MMDEGPTKFVNPALLAWARRLSALPLSLAAHKIGVSEDELQRWESGASKPSLPQLRKSAEVYQRPLAIFFLPEPPKGFTPIADYRRHVSDDAESTESVRLAAAIRAAHERRAFLLDTLDPVPRPFPFTASDSGNPDEAAAHARKILGVTEAQQFSLRTARQALRVWTEAVERLGVLVFQVSGIEEAEMRGVSLANDVLPVILLNGRDADRGKLFSLLHELGHLGARSGGICNLSETRAPEVYCNRFAAAVLMPTDVFGNEALVRTRKGPSEWSDDELVRLSKKYGASTQSVLLRLLALGKVTQAYYEARAVELREAAARLKRKPEGGDYWATYFRDRGVGYIRSVLEAYYEGRATLRDAAYALEIKPKFFDRVEREAWAEASASA